MTQTRSHVLRSILGRTDIDEFTERVLDSFWDRPEFQELHPPRSEVRAWVRWNLELMARWLIGGHPPDESALEVCESGFDLCEPTLDPRQPRPAKIQGRFADLQGRPARIQARLADLQSRPARIQAPPTRIQAPLAGTQKKNENS